jgi:2,3-bisphosphoglycerate-dependent phosphoglycerate mutase
VTTTRIYVLRHGETEWNHAERLQGHSDSPLSAKGQAQVEALGKRFQKLPIAALYTSDLGRAVASARPIAEATGRAAILDARLRERRLGVFEALTRTEAASHYPDLYQTHELHDPAFTLPGGQSLQEHSLQTLEAVRDIAGRHVGEAVALITHGGALSALFRASVGVSLDTPRAFSIANAALNAFDLVGGRLKLICWGDTAHFEQFAVPPAPPL